MSIRRVRPWMSTLPVLLALGTGVGLGQSPGTTGYRTEGLPKTLGTVERFDPAADAILPADAAIEVLAEGFEWSEGPVWVAKEGKLLFSDIPNNRVVAWRPRDRKLAVEMEPAGYTGEAKFTGTEPGTNGLALDADGRLVMCCHGDRCLRRREADGTLTVLASRHDGKRFNSPNDLAIHSSGAIYFTDPPYGLPKGADDPAREIDVCGVYRVDDKGVVTLLTDEMTRPNGIAFSPDEKTLYVANSDPKAAIIKAFPVKADGTLGPGKVIFDATADVSTMKGLPDGLAVAPTGHLFATAPGGVSILTPEGKRLARLNTGEATANCTFGPDGVLYITADMYLCRVKTSLATK